MLPNGPPQSAIAVPASQAVQAALVIDDDELVCRTVAGQLKRAGIRNVTAVSDPAEAVRLLTESGPFGLIVSDLSMPKFDGIQMIRWVAARQPQAALLLMSSASAKLLSSAESLARSRGLRVLAALQKPVRTEDLQRLILELSRQTSHAEGSAAALAITAADLQAALAEGEIQLHVQPQINARNGALHGVEALARWHSSKHGTVPASRFIELAERNGMIGEITEMMLAKSLAACGAWKRAGLQTRISVNAPAGWLCGLLNLPDVIVDLSGDCGIEPDQLTLEVTESGFAGDIVPALDVLTRLRLRGVDLAIDDFGCGYSSLQQLKHMPFNELKIDCSFVMNMLKDPQSHSIVKSSIELCRDLGLRAVAEGVESRAHWDALLEMGCDVLQGFYLAPAFPIDQLPNWWSMHHAWFRR